MNTRVLGKTNLHTAPIIFGGNVFGWTLNEKESFEILDKFLEMGFNTIDTADVYSRWIEGNEGGESETIIGKWMKDRGVRDKVNIITKVGSDMGQGQKDLSEKHICKAVDDSLKRLQTDHIDLYLSHWDDKNTPVEETLGAYHKLIQWGKIRFVGASNLSPERLRESLHISDEKEFPHYKVFQPEYNLYEREAFENGIGPVCQEEGIAVITYFSLASGFLTGKYRDPKDFDKSARGKGMHKYLNARGVSILNVLDKLADKYGVSQAAISLAWLITNPWVTAPIASATKESHLKAFKDATEISLQAEDMELLESASAYEVATSE